MIAVHDVLRGLGEFLDELVRRGRAAEHRIDALRTHTLLLHGARKQDVFVVVVRRNDEIGVLRLDLQHDVVEVARRRRMRDGLQHLEPALGQLRVEELGEARAERGILVHDHHRLRRLAGLVVDGDEIVERGLGDDAKARAEPEGVLQPAGDDAVDHADVHDIGQVIARRGLAGRQGKSRWRSRRRWRERRPRSFSRPRRCRLPASIGRRRAWRRSWRRPTP